MNAKIKIVAAALSACLALLCVTSTAAEKIMLSGPDLSAWQTTRDWSVVGDAFLNPRNENLLSVTKGEGVITNNRQINSSPLVSRKHFADMRAHIEFIIPKKTTSGVLFQGRYELNICDSYGEPNAATPGIECGGIYPRWDESRLAKAYDGRSPLVNTSHPAGQWQSFDVIFRAPRFDNEGRKIENASFVKVYQNGILIHQNHHVSGPGRNGISQNETTAGPLVLLGDRGAVAFRNIWIIPLELDAMGLTNPFFAMDTGTIDEMHTSAESQVLMLKELGYDGIGYWERKPSAGTAGLKEMLTELDKNGLKTFTIYFAVKLEEPKENYLPLISDSIKLLANRNAVIWLAIASDKYRASSHSGDNEAVAIINEIADLAHENAVNISLYPHSDFWLEKVEDAVRLAQKSNRRNVGITFNLYHWLKTDRPANMEEVLTKAMPYLSVVTINGTTEAGSIETLDSGTFDVYRFLKLVKQKGFEGPVGLQGYGIGADVRENLRRSMEAWREFSQRLAIEETENL